MDIKVLASGSSGNCYLISDGKTTLLLDAGIPFKKIQEGCNFNTSSIDGCLITHRHNDHSKSLPELIMRGFTIYSNADVCEIFKGVKMANTVVLYTIGTFTFRSFSCQHDVPCYGYLIESQITGERLLYFTDTAYIKYKFKNIHYIMAEANYDIGIMADNAKYGSIPYFVGDRVLQTHMSIDTLLEFLKANDLKGLKDIYLLHLSNGNSDAAEFKLRIQKETGAIVHVY